MNLDLLLDQFIGAILEFSSSRSHWFILLVCVWVAISFSAGVNLPTVGGGICIALHLMATLLLNRFHDYWANLTPTEGVRNSTYLQNLRVLCTVGLGVFTIIGFMTLS